MLLSSASVRKVVQSIILSRIGNLLRTARQSCRHVTGRLSERGACSLIANTSGWCLSMIFLGLTDVMS